jgi:hypothetical protein
MLIPKKIVEEVEATIVEVNAKVTDRGCYGLKGPEGELIAELDGYVPKIFPGNHYGDYLLLEIELETGLIKNWKKPSPREVALAFGIIKEEDE